MTEAMLPSEMRSELIGQHDEIRARIEETRAAIAAARAGEATHERFLGALSRLASALGTHNAREESLLRDVIPGVDAWGPARADVMFSEHIKEHDLLYESLLRSAQTPEGSTVESVAALLDELTAHMAREEEAFLGEEVLHDDLLPPGVITG